MTRTLQCGWLWLVLAAAALCGCSGGPSGSVPAGTTGGVVAGKAPIGPRLVVKQASIDAGELEFGNPKDYVFNLENAGDQPLTLQVVSKACSCSDIQLPSEIAPGKTADVRVKWGPNPGVVGPVRLPTGLKTNDPARATLTLEVKGQINPRVRIFPTTMAFIDFDDMVPGRPAKRVLNVYSTKLSEFGLGATFRDGNEPPAYQAVVTPLESGAEIDGQRIKSGYTVTVTTLDNPPRGYLRRELVLSTSVPGEAAHDIVLPVYGRVDNGVFTVAPTEVEFKAHNLADGDQVKAAVNFLVPSPNEKVEVIRCEPSFIQAETPRLAVSGKFGRWFLTFRIPKDNPAALKFQPEKFFEGTIYLKVSGSDTPVSVRVKWNPS